MFWLVCDLIMSITRDGVLQVKWSWDGLIFWVQFWIIKTWSRSCFAKYYLDWTEQAKTSESARIPQLKREATNVRKFYSFNLWESRNNLSSKISAVEKSRTSEISRDFSSRQKFSNQLNSSFSYENCFHYHCAGFWRLLTRFKLPWNYESDIKIKL